MLSSEEVLDQIARGVVAVYELRSNTLRIQQMNDCEGVFFELKVSPGTIQMELDETESIRSPCQNMVAFEGEQRFDEVVVSWVDGRDLSLVGELTNQQLRWTRDLAIPDLEKVVLGPFRRFR